ncbi:hypothetical protein KY289_016535 [Solanum tuberosum]|nr:hypothetical protein KY289_016535 [Solanum tuberosum]
MSSTHSKSSSSSSVAIQSTILQGNIRKINFCQFCGGPNKHEIPDGEEKVRAICTRCGKITYENPKMVVGCLIEHDKKILMCRRKIHPSYGLWTLPAGYMEIGESAAEGAIRETWEEANAEVEVQSLFAQLDIPLIGQTYMIFLAKLKNPHFSPGPESSECQLFELDDIPYDSLAFSSMLVTLNLYIEDIKVGRPKFHYGVINKRGSTISLLVISKLCIVELLDTYAGGRTGLEQALLKSMLTHWIFICNPEKQIHYFQAPERGWYVHQDRKSSGVFIKALVVYLW